MILFRCILYTHNIRCVVAALLEGNGLAEMNTTSHITYSASSPLCFEGNGLAETWRGLIATRTTTYDTQGDATRQIFDVDARILHSASSPLCFERNGMATPDQHTPHPIRHTTYIAETWRGIIAARKTAYATQGGAIWQIFAVDVRAHTTM